MTNYWCELAVVDGMVRQDVAITISDGRFASVQPDAPQGSAKRLAGLSLPGLANAHSHAFHRALRSRTQTNRGSFWTWREVMYQAAERLTPDNYFRLARATFGEMALAGITVVGEFHYVHHQLDGSNYSNPNAMGNALLAAASEAGIRITLLDALYLHGGLTSGGYTEPVGAQLRYSDGTADAWVERVDQLEVTPGQQVGAAIHSVRAVDPEAMKVVAHWADQHDAPLHAHVSEQRTENHHCLGFHAMTPTEVLAQALALGPRFSAVHATHLSNTDIGLLARSKASVCLCPTTERDLGDGIGPTPELGQGGIAMTLGSDSHAMIDHFEECRAVEMNERLRSELRGVHTARDLLAMATTAGHSSLGWTDAGSIVKGNRADLITLDTESPRTAGSTPATAIEAAVFAASAADVTHVVADGLLIVEDRNHLRMDVASELQSSIAELMGDL